MNAETVEVFLAAASSHQQCLPPAQGPIERANTIREYPSIRVALGDLKHCVSKSEFRSQVDANTTCFDRRGRRVMHSVEQCGLRIKCHSPTDKNRSEVFVSETQFANMFD